MINEITEYDFYQKQNKHWELIPDLTETNGYGISAESITIIQNSAI